MPPARPRRAARCLYLLLLSGLTSSLYAERSSSQRSPPLEDEAAELFRDAPLYPPLRDHDAPLDIPELTEQTNLAYDTESSIEDSNLLVTPEETLDTQDDLSESIIGLSEIENSAVDEENSDDTDVDDETSPYKHPYTDVNYFKSSFLNYQDIANDIFEASRYNEENSDNNDNLKNEVDRVVRNVKQNTQEELLEDWNVPDAEVNDAIPEPVDSSTGKEVTDNILVGADISNVESENTILMTSDKNENGELGILLAPDSTKNFKDSSVYEEESIVNEDISTMSPEDLNNFMGLKNSPDQKNEDAEINKGRVKRSGDIEKSSKPSSRRVITGDTILNIRGAVRDAIGDAGAAPGPRPSTRLDAFVIRPAARTAPRDQPRPWHEEPTPTPTPPTPLASQKLERELLVAAHTYVRIPCDLTNVTNLRWYKDSEPAVLSAAENAGAGAGAGAGAAAGADGALHIARAASPHAARWRCAGVDGEGRARAGRPTRLLVYEPVRSVYLAVDGRRLDAGNTWVPVRDKTVLEVRCVAEGGVPAPELSWRLLAQEPALDHRPYLRVHQTNRSLDGMRWSRTVVTAARELHNATLRCVAAQRRPAPAPAHPPGPATPVEPDQDGAPSAPTAGPAPLDDLTAKLQIHVTYPPSFVISRWPGFGARLMAGGAAALRCDVDANPPARAHWLRDDDTPASSPTPLEGEGESRGSATLRWSVLSESHAGWYRCRASWLDAEYSSIGYYLNVLSRPEEPAARAHEEPEQQKLEVPLGGNVQLHCPKGTVGCWWRRIVGNASENWAPAGSHHAHGVLGIRGALYQEAGEYRCVGARGAELQRMRELKRVTLRVTGGASATAASVSAAPAGGWRLECVACGRGVRALWLRGATAAPAATAAHLAPHAAPHCYRAVLHIAEPDEVWCVAVTSGGAAVAVFPRRSPPAPARRAQPGGAPSGGAARASPHLLHLPHLLLLLLLLPPLLLPLLLLTVAPRRAGYDLT